MSLMGDHASKGSAAFEKAVEKAVHKTVSDFNTLESCVDDTLKAGSKYVLACCSDAMAAQVMLHLLVFFSNMS